MVPLELKVAGFVRRRRVIQVEPLCEIGVLRRLVSQELGLVEDSQVNRLKLVFRGKALGAADDYSTVDIRAGDSLLVLLPPKAPSVHSQSKNEDEDDDLRFKLPATASPLQRRLVQFLKHNLKFPDFVLMIIFSFGFRRWMMVLLWLIVAGYAISWDLGHLYIIATIFCLIVWNLGKRQEGEISAYSIFNDDFHEIPGTFNAERLDRHLRAGMY
ncbi:hypothetical protein SELMODRAFT_451430 [Selaginella moellendorffii]|uniref:SAYSvFN domain-containing protein n=1 Tax=Selaginella moellendorffii TaxID=88036 RepID=D8TAU8_SELML|nr:uncharacterized protein LOC9630567 [Selaginella moellendorffii]EFJ06190.1 hypothetical protein SELMODRAFT_451430 [Selaginella moellendorffii]|eukprot:XP_002992709.1 uncharacterized protein LOC9630567 [Selaginella moellendorffii]